MTFSSLKPGAKRTCKNRACRNKFVPSERHPFAIACCAGCEIILAKQHIEKVQAARAKKERKELKARKEAVKRRSEWVSEAQAAFNAYVRARDAGKPCICCGKPFEPQKPGGSVDAGHYLSRGSAPHLRFDERNCFAQRKNCNRPGGTTREAFRNGVVDRIGLPAVEALEAEQGLAKWTIQELKEIKTTYRAKLKQLQGLMGVGDL
jgi:hypothetical protein